LAVRALATTGKKRHHHPLARRQVVNAVARPDDTARGLMTEEHRHRAGSDSVDDRKIGVAQTGGLDLDQNLSGAWLIELELDHADRLRLGVRA
jgi:hypothetical protein